jgi:hypothetical protein
VQCAYFRSVFFGRNPSSRPYRSIPTIAVWFIEEMLNVYLFSPSACVNSPHNLIDFTLISIVVSLSSTLFMLLKAEIYQINSGTLKEIYQC